MASSEMLGLENGKNELFILTIFRVNDHVHFFMDRTGFRVPAKFPTRQTHRLRGNSIHENKRIKVKLW